MRELKQQPAMGAATGQFGGGSVGTGNRLYGVKYPAQADTLNCPVAGMKQIQP